MERIFNNLRGRLRGVPNFIRQELGVRLIRSTTETDLGTYYMNKRTTQNWYGIGEDDELGGLGKIHRLCI